MAMVNINGMHSVSLQEILEAAVPDMCLFEPPEGFATKKWGPQIAHLVQKRKNSGLLPCNIKFIAGLGWTVN